MPKQSVTPVFPIDFSEVCEVVSQDLLGTDGRSLFGPAPGGMFAQAIIQGGTFNNGPGRNNLSDFLGYSLLVIGECDMSGGSVDQIFEVLDECTVIGGAKITFLDLEGCSIIGGAKASFLSADSCELTGRASAIFL